MAEQLSWDKWRAKAKKAYKKGVYTANDMVRDWGYPKGVDPAEFRMIFRSGEPGKKSREAINIGKAKSNKGRTVKETYSTNLAGAARRAQDKQFQTVLDEASLFALNNKELATMIEHGVALNVSDVVDSPDASGDPTNRYLQPVTKGISKTDAENYLISQGLEDQVVIMQDEQTGKNRFVPAKTANTFQFPSEQGQPFNNLADLKKLATGLAAGGVAAIYGGMGTAASAAEVGVRGKIADQTGNPIDRLQQGIAGLSLGADVASYAPPLAVPASIASGVLDATNMGIDTTRGLIKEASRYVTQGLDAFLPKFAPSSKLAQPAKPYTPSIVPPTTDFTSKSSPAGYTAPGLFEFLKGI